MSFQSFSPDQAISQYKTLYQNVKRQYYSFNGFDQFNLRIFKGNFLILKNRFNRKIYGWLENMEPKILVTHYIAKDKSLGVPHSLGSILVDDLLEEKAIRAFQKELVKRLSSIDSTILTPFNGHMNLGFSVPAPGVDPKRISVLTSPSSSGIDMFFNEGRYFKKERTYFALVKNIESRKASCNGTQSSHHKKNSDQKSASDLRRRSCLPPERMAIGRLGRSPGQCRNKGVYR